MEKKFLIILCCMVFCLSGCAKGQEAGYDLQETGQEAGRQGEEPASAGTAVPAACVDRMGYEPEKEKIVIFQGTGLPDTFALVDAETDDVVYSGAIQKKGNEEDDDEYNAYGDFSAYERPGKYYIRTDIYGESYPFLIHDNLYDSLLRSTFDGLYRLKDTKEYKAERDFVTDSALILYRLLLSYEMFPDIHGDDRGIRESGNAIPDLLDLCRIQADLLAEQAPGEGEDGIYQAAALAKYAYLTRSMDGESGEECLKAAESAWKSASQSLFVSDGQIAMAAAELYRLTGSRQYLGLTEDYLRAAAEKEDTLPEAEFYAAVTYMNTRSTVDMELCDALMKKIMEEAEQTAELAKQNPFLVCGQDGGTDVLLQQAGRLCVVNHIITNHEYGTVIDNYLHFLMGRNPESICHISWWDADASISTDEEGKQDGARMAMLFFVLSERMTNE